MAGDGGDGDDGEEEEGEEELLCSSHCGCREPEYLYIPWTDWEDAFILLRQVFLSLLK